MTRRTVLVVDDDPAFHTLFQASLALFGWEGICVGSGEEGLALLERRRLPLVFLEVVLPGMGGLDVLREIKARSPGVDVAMVSGRRDTRTVVQAMQLGAADYLVKPVQEAELQQTLAQVRIHTESPERRSDPPHRSRQEDQVLVGDSAFLRELFVLIEHVMDTDATILLEGESGVGKGIIAHVIHDRSGRWDQPFIHVNCAALPAELLEAELFGYERGAFTGAVRKKPGRFDLAQGGTLLLDEVGEIPLGIQAKLLHVLQDSAFSRLGGEADVHVDVRVIAASNRDLKSAVHAGTFRPDLYYRLDVMKIIVPPLRERREEIPGLAHFFHAKFCRKYGRKLPPLGPATLDALMAYPWPGNIRELENAVKRMVLLGTEAGIPLEDPPMPGQPGVISLPGSSSDLKEVSRRAAREAERVLIASTLQQTGWNRAETARRLWISYKALLYKMKACGLAPPVQKE